MFNRMGKARFVVPLVIVALVICVVGLLFYPMAHMEIKNLPFAVISLDEGVETPQGVVDVGATLVDGITSASPEDDAPISWTEFDHITDLEQALENNDYYGSLIIPEDYTATSLAAQSAAQAGAESPTEMPALKIILDNAKSPLIAQQMKGTIGSMFEQMGIDVEVEVIHRGPSAENESASPMAGMMGQQIAIMPLCMAAMICAVLISNSLFPIRKLVGKARWKTLGVQIGVLAASTLVAAICSYGAVVFIGGVDAPAAPSILFFWLASFCVSLLLTGAFDIAAPLGVLVALCVFVLGMATGTLPYESLPAFWQDWVFPWAPQNYIGQGVREILFMNAGAWNGGSGPLTIMGAIGVGLLALSGLIPRREEQDRSA